MDCTGDEGAPAASSGQLNEAFVKLSAELRAIASSHMRNQSGSHTLSPTALVNEAYLKFSNASSGVPTDRAAFLALASHAMRQILVDHARRKKRLKRGGDAARITLVDHPIRDGAPPLDALAIHDAIERLSTLDERIANLVEMRCFGGMTIEECAEAMGVARSTVTEKWRFARVWLHRELFGDHAA